MAWIYKRAGSKFWWIGWRAQGQQHLQSTGKTAKKEAQTVLQQYELMNQASKASALTRQFYLTLAGSAAKSTPLSVALAEWVEVAESSKAPTTATKYRTEARLLAEFLGATESGPMVEEIDSKVIRRFLSDRRTNTSTATANLAKKILSGFFQKQVKEEVIQSNPVRLVDTLKETGIEKRRAKRRAFTLAEVQLAFSKAPDDFWRYMLLMGFFTGLRLGDAACMRWGSADFETGFIRVTASKTAKVLNIPMHPTLADFLRGLKPKNATARAFIWEDRAEAYLKQGGGSLSNEFYDLILFPCGLVPARNYRAPKNGQNRARAESRLSFHSLRHTFVSLLKISGGNQAVARELAGHSSDIVSDLYTHLPEESLRGAIDQLPEVSI
jgi:integrase